MTSNRATFLENKGQIHDLSGHPVPFVLFSVNTPALDLYVTETGLTYVFRKRNNDGGEKWERVDVVLKNALIRKSNIRPQQKSSWKSDFYDGHSPSGITDVHSYEKITINSVYEGIDWVLYNSGEAGFKYDFILHPGADPNLVRLQYSSVLQPVLGVQGTLKIPGSLGDLEESAPYTYRESDKKEIACTFKILSQEKKADHYETLIGYRMQQPGVSQETIIDPQLTWSTFYGGSASEDINSIALDSAGNVFATGSTGSVNFPTNNNGGYFQGSISPGMANDDAFILKFDNAGTLLWATYYGGSSNDVGTSVTCGPGGDVHLAGYTNSQNFPVMSSGGYYQPLNTNAGYEIFILHFDNSGNRISSTYLGGAGFDRAYAIDADQAGNVFLTGTTTSTNFPLQNAGTYFNGNNPSGSSFIIKLDNGGSLAWSTFWGSGNITGRELHIDAAGRVIIAGDLGTAGFFPTMQAGPGSFFQSTSGGGTDGFVARFSNQGNLQWSTRVRGSSADMVASVATDTSGNIFLCGSTQSQNFPVMNASTFYQGTLGSAGNTDAFIMKFDSALVLKWSTYYGGGSSELMLGNQHLAIDDCGNIYMAFQTLSYDMKIRRSCDGGFMDSTYSSSDHFLTRFSNNGQLHWATFFGGDGVETNINLGTDGAGNLFAAGSWNFVGNSASYPLFYPGPPAYYTPNFSGQHDAFLAKFAKPGVVGAQNFSYKSPFCIKGGSVSPIFSSGFIGGGTFTSSAGLAIQPLTGVLTLSASAAGVYTVSYSGGNCGCLTGPPLTATVEVSPSFSVTVSSATACTNNPATLIASLTTTLPADYHWEAGESSDTIQVAPVASTVYNVTVTIGGCTATAGGSITVSNPVVPQTTFFYDNPLCTNNKEALPRHFAGFDSSGYYRGTGIQVDSLTGKILVDSLKTGDYLVTYSVPAQGCVAAGSATFMVTVNDPGMLGIQTHVAVKPGESITLDVKGGSGVYVWTPTVALSCTDCAAPVASPAETTEYCVASFINSCYTATCVLVEVLCGNGGNLTVPNAFTPNNDGRNENFCLQGWKRCNTFFKVMIYNRWGELLFESDDPDFCWDGHFNGELLGSDVYVYVISASFNNEEKITRKGNITLIR